MRGYPSEESIPPVAQERACFAAWAGLSLLSFIAYGLIMIDLHLRPTDLLMIVVAPQPGFAMLGILGFWLRRRRLTRVKARDEFLASLARLNSASD